MAPRTSWKGFIKLSLVSVPVKAFTAHDSNEQIRLNQLHKDCNGRVRYRKVCVEHGELSSDEIVSGYEYAKDQYVVIDPDELSKLRPASEKAVSIQGFIAPEDVDPIYLAGRTYYLLPDGVAGNKPYALLHRGMIDKKVFALAQVVMSGREQLVMLRPVENMIAMSVVHYAKKVKPIDTFTGELEDEKLTKEELKLTETLIDASRIEDFDLENYGDAYIEKLKELIQLKVDGEEIVQAPDPEEPKIINLMDALKKSVAEAQTGAKKMAPSVGKKKKKAAKNTKRKKTG